MDWDKVFKKLLLPPAWLIAVLTAISAVSLMAVFVKGLEQSIAAYILYVLAFYTLTVACIYLYRVLPKQIGKIKEAIYRNPFGNRYMTDPAFRTQVSLYLSLGISLMYVGVHLLSWHLHQSWWFMVLAAYYAILAVMRFLLVRYVRANAIGASISGEWKRSRICACILLLVNLSLSGAVLMILYQNRGYHYDGILIYVMAAYTFYSVIHAIVEIVRYRSMGIPVMSTAKIVSLCAALVSLLNLETAMFAQFGGDMNPGDQRLMIALTGAGVSIAVVSLSAGLIAKATKEIRRNYDGE